MQIAATAQRAAVLAPRPFHSLTFYVTAAKSMCEIIKTDSLNYHLMSLRSSNLKKEMSDFVSKCKSFCLAMMKTRTKSQKESSMI